jgi:hypothetical protein
MTIKIDRMRLIASIKAARDRAREAHAKKLGDTTKQFAQWRSRALAELKRVTDSIKAAKAPADLYDGSWPYERRYQPDLKGFPESTPPPFDSSKFDRVISALELSSENVIACKDGDDYLKYIDVKA